ncbi:hypothetical protein LMH87_002892 [Akanthomyces muscarius]|uniref:DNA topoisomerase (ATP-hydrolyzing) n=1 Tax=Akanthomyces muscarius TaxID=2231603 RepID=A0A9W8Q7Z8_AKAMU|nr:hypothetical protein LMH87_002892 [Akanthomyces muscarius]KAJ4148422.1 hypothetical protein LMH87_002892 [Akanthomyces muscarius]
MSLNRSMAARSRLPSASVIGRIEAALEGVADSLANANELKIPFCSRRRRSRPADHEENFVRFPGSSASEARKFARLLLIMQLAHQAMITGTILTKRHIYYQHQELFETQRVVDELVDDLAYTLGTDRDDLNITASSKGLVSGCMVIRLRSSQVLDASQSELGITIPSSRSVTCIETRGARWLLVVEKDAVFRSLVAVRFWETSLAGPGILITARGYPDLMTRSFLARIQSDCPHLPMFVLTDFDPDGLSIFSCYRYGTTNFFHESSNSQINFGWLGIQSGHLGTLHKTKTDGIRNDFLPLECCKRICRQNMGIPCVAEIQALDESGDITPWLDIFLQKILGIIP